MKSAGERIQQLRKERGWTQKQLADNTGISLQSIKLYERGAGIPSNKRSNGTLDKIAEVFGVFPEWIISGEGDKNKLKGLKAFKNSYDKYLLAEKIWSEIQELYELENIPAVSNDLYNKMYFSNTSEKLTRDELLELLSQAEAKKALKNSIFNFIEARVAQYKKSYGGKRNG